MMTTRLHRGEARAVRLPLLAVALVLSGCMGATPPGVRSEPLSFTGGTLLRFSSSGSVPPFAVASDGMSILGATVASGPTLLVDRFMPGNDVGRTVGSVPLTFTGPPVLASSRGGGVVLAAVTITPTLYALPSGIPTSVAGCGSQVLALDLSDDGSLVAVGTPEAVCVYATATWTSETSAPPGSGGAVALAGTGDRLFIGGTSLEVRARSGTSWAIEASLPLGGDASTVACDESGSHVVVAQAGMVRFFARSGTSWSTAGSFSAGLGPVAMTSDGLRAVVGQPGPDEVLTFVRGITGWRASTTATGFGLGLGEVVALSDDGAFLVSGSSMLSALGGIGELGDPCSSDAQCALGVCADGVCCNTPCGGSSADCMACSAAAGGREDGQCTALSGAAAPTVTCRPLAGTCDVAEVCVAGSTSCPADAFRPFLALCRPRAGLCDREEVCSGTAADCPPDATELAGTACGGAGMGSCGTPGVCDGGPECSGSVPRPSGTVCLPAGPSSPCDVDDTCDGSSTLCQPRFAPADTSCGPDPTDVCDAPDHCTGTSADCEAVYLEGVVCRSPAGSCDAAETCTGAGPACPADAVLNEGLVCNPSTSACDPAESCDGVAATCPRDVDCVSVSDAGEPGVTDAGAPPAPVSSCSCRTLGAGSGAGGALASLVILVLGRARRARRAVAVRLRT